MPRYLPRPDLPPFIFRLLTERKYQEGLRLYFQGLPEASRGLKKVSTTTLARSSRQRVLEERHDHEITANPTEKMWSLMGTLVHEMLEKHGRKGDIVEERMGIDLGPFPDGSMIHAHGQPDLFTLSEDSHYENGVLMAHIPKNCLIDFKLTGAWALAKGEKLEHAVQANVNRWMLEKKGYTVEHMKNIFFFRDWKSHEARRSEQYPQDKIVVMDMPRWSNEKTEAYIMERLWHHASGDGLTDDELPPCSPLERWQGMPEYKVYKKREMGEWMANSKFTSSSRLEAEEWMEESQLTEWGKIVSKNAEKAKPKPESELIRPKYKIKEIPAQPEKCLGFCPVKGFCSQYKADIASGNIKIHTEDQDDTN